MPNQKQPAPDTVRDSRLDAFEGVERVVAEPLRFKARLAIGENAYASLRTINRARELWDVMGAAGAGAAIAKSSLVASTFFAPSGLLGALGIGAASTPIGWVAFAALASGGACYGLYRLLGHSKGSRVIEIPKFLNTPLDTLGLALFDLIAPLALRMAAVDGAIEAAERQYLTNHLVDDWGLDRAFVTQALALIEPRVLESSLADMAKELSDFLQTNPDCNHKEIAKDLVEFLRGLLEAAGPLTVEEEAALASTRDLLLTERPSALAESWRQAQAYSGQAAGHVRQAVTKAVAWSEEQLPTAEQVKAATQRSADWAKAGLGKVKDKLQR